MIRHRRFVRPHGSSGGGVLLQRAMPILLAGALALVVNERHVDRSSGRGGIEAVVQHPYGGQKEQ